MIYITGDLHGDLECFKAPAIKKLRRGDTLLVCGDFGFIWNGTPPEQRILKKLGRKRFQICFVDGVHENHKLLSSYPVTQWNGGKVQVISGRLLHLMRGQIYTLEGTRFFALGGGEASEADSCSSALTEGSLPTLDDLNEANLNLQKYDYVVDYVVTHDCSAQVRSFLNTEGERYNHLSAFFNEAAKVIEFKKWFFGCLHLDKAIPPKYQAVYRDVVPCTQPRK